MGYKDYTGQKYGMLTFIKFMYRKNHSAHWLCKCDCGKEKIIDARTIRIGRAKSCGCITNKLISTHRKIHKLGMTHGMSGTRFHNIFRSMTKRCRNKNDTHYKYYGGRGIKCLRNIFEEFRNDMYESYLKHIEEFGEHDTTIDRIDNNGHYCKENCRRANKYTQQHNMRSNNNCIGVCKYRNTYKNPRYARIGVNGKNICLGSFKTQQEAYEARLQAEIKYGIKIE